MMNLIFDADMLLFVSLLESEKAVHWSNDIWTLHCDMREACVYYDNFVTDLTEKVLNHTSMMEIICCSCVLLTKSMIISVM